MNLKALRESLGMTLGQLADASGVPKTTIADIERGGNCTINTLARIVTGLGGKLEIKVHIPERVTKTPAITMRLTDEG